MTALNVMLVCWGVLNVALIGIFIYRGTLALHEDDQLFLEDSELYMAKEQSELLLRLEKLNRALWILGPASLLMMVVIGGMWLVQLSRAM